MNYAFKTGEGFTNLTTGERSFRTALGLGLIATVMVAEGPLGYLALVPLLATYPLMTATLAWDPVYWMLTAGNKGARMADDTVLMLFSSPKGDGMIHERTAERIERLVVGGALVGVPFVTEGFLGWQAIFPLLGIYPLMSAALGIDLVDYINSRRKPAPAATVVPFPVTPGAGPTRKAA
jgi:hypothetical protein